MVRVPGDTLTYTIELEDSAGRDKFIAAFEMFLEEYPFEELEADTLRRYVRFKVTAPSALPEGQDTIELSTLEEAQIQEGIIEQAIDSLVQMLPAPGGSARLYSDRPFIDNTFAELIRGRPFTSPILRLPPDSSRAGTQDSTAEPPDTLSARLDTATPVTAATAYLSAEALGPRRVAITLAQSLRNAAGQPLTAFEIVESWSAYIKEHPAEGLALFRHVKGVRGFIEGREAIIPGFAVADNQHITLMLHDNDPHVLDRLGTDRLLPPSLGVGPYALMRSRENRLMLVPNKNHHTHRGFLDKCVLVLGGDKNPFLGYSLKKYDCVAITSRKDLEYARRSLEEGTRLDTLSKDRYFIALNIDPIEARRSVWELIDPAAILKGAVKAEGEVLASVESDSLAPPPETKQALGQAPYVERALRVVFREDDAVSARIADKVFADLSHLGVACELMGGNALEYESALVDRAYELAIGWVPREVLSRRSEQLRLATMWFGDNTNESQRLGTYAERPLFAVRRHLLCRGGIKLYRGNIRWVYRQEHQ